MKFKTQSKPAILITVIIVIPFLLLWFIYVYFLQPKKDQLSQMQAQVQMEQKSLAMLNQKYLSHQNDLGKGSKILQQQLPVEPLVDQFLLQMEKAEIMSDSQITAVSVSDVNPTESTNAKGQAKPQSSTSGDKAKQLPEQLQKVTLQISVNSADYSKMRQFLNVVEEQNRIATIDSISFSEKTEDTTRNDKKTDQPPEELKYQVSVTSYFAPKIKDLINDLPWIKYSEPSHKENPLYPGVPADAKSKKSK